MPSSFINYLKTPEANLESCYRSIELANSQGSIGVLSRILNDCLQKSDTLTFEESALSRLLTAFHTHLKSISQNQDLQNLIKEMIAVACAEILNENGETETEIFKLLKLDTTSWTQRETAPYLLCSFISLLLIETIHKYWRQNLEYREDIANCIPREPLIQLFQTSLHTEDTDPRIIDAIETTFADQDLQTLLPMMKPALLPTTISEAIIRALKAQKWSLKNTLKKAIEPNALETSLTATLTEILEKEIESHIDLTLGSSLQQINIALRTGSNEMLDGKIKDYSLYGKPIVESFNKYEGASFASQSRQQIIELTRFFDRIFIRGDSQQRTLNNFVTKIIFVTYSNILDEEANLKNEFANNHEDPQRPLLIVSYLRIILLEVINLWLKTEFFNSPVEASDLDLIVEKIETRLAQGLQTEFLEKIYGFPIFGRAEIINNFAMSFSISGISQEEDILQLKTKLANTKKLCATIANHIANIEETSQTVMTACTRAIAINNAFRSQEQIFSAFSDAKSLSAPVRANFEINEAFLTKKTEALHILQSIAEKLKSNPVNLSPQGLAAFSDQVLRVKKSFELSVENTLDATSNIIAMLSPWLQNLELLKKLNEICSDLNIYVTLNRRSMLASTNTAADLGQAYLAAQNLLKIFFKENPANFLQANLQSLTQLRSDLIERYDSLAERQTIKAMPLSDLIVLDQAQMLTRINQTKLPITEKTAQLSAITNKITNCLNPVIETQRRALPTLTLIHERLLKLLAFLHHKDNNNRLNALALAIANDHKFPGFDLKIKNILDAYQQELQLESQRFLRRFSLFNPPGEVMDFFQIIEALQEIFKTNPYNRQHLETTVNLRIKDLENTIWARPTRVQYYR